MLKDSEFETLQKLAKGIAAQFGSDCEVVVHRLSEETMEHSIVAIENGHVTGRKVGDGPSHVVLEQLGKKIDPNLNDHLCYLTRTRDGKLLKSSSIYIRGDDGQVGAIFCINFDISALSMVEHSISELVSPKEVSQKEPERITLNVSDLLDDLILQSVELVGKPVALMTKEDKIKAVQFLGRNGAMLITKSGDKISKHFGISKYTLYSYLDNKTGGN